MGRIFYNCQHPGQISGGFKTTLLEQKVCVGKIKLVRFEKQVVARQWGLDCHTEKSRPYFESGEESLHLSSREETRSCGVGWSVWWRCAEESMEQEYEWMQCTLRESTLVLNTSYNRPQSSITYFFITSEYIFQLPIKSSTCSFIKTGLIFLCFSLK